MQRPKEEYCRLIQLAIERNEKDLEVGQERGLFYDSDEADSAVEFFSFLRHSKGEWAGKPFELEYSQEHHIIRPIFGWKKPNFEWDNSKPFDWDLYPPDQFPEKYVRRFNIAYVQKPKKNGKSTEAAGIGTLLLFEGEPAPEIYSAGAKKEQAELVHVEAKRMIETSPQLAEQVEIYRNNISIPSEYAIWKCFTKQAKGADGVNVHGGIVDELHQWPWSAEEILNILTESTITRLNWLIYIITTAGDSRNSLCYQKRVYAEKVLRGIIQDDRFFSYICEPTKEELDKHGWDSLELAKLVNPGWGEMIQPHRVKEAIKEARADSRAKTKYLRYRLNLWVANQEQKIIDIEKWRDRRLASYWEPGLAKQRCFIGVDLSNRIDLTAIVLTFPLGQGFYVFKPFFWVPEDNVIDRVERDNVPYDTWIHQGFLQTTPGNSVDYEVVKDKIYECCGLYDVEEIAIDPWNAGKFGSDLTAEGLKVVEVRQGVHSLNDPCKFLQVLSLSGHGLHNDHPVLNWCISNCIGKEDNNGNITPDKSKSEEKIDGFSAMVTGLNRVLKKIAEEENIYPNSGLIVV